MHARGAGSAEWGKGSGHKCREEVKGFSQPRSVPAAVVIAHAVARARGHQCGSSSTSGTALLHYPIANMCEQPALQAHEAMPRRKAPAAPPVAPAGLPQLCIGPRSVSTPSRRHVCVCVCVSLSMRIPLTRPDVCRTMAASPRESTFGRSAGVGGGARHCAEPGRARSEEEGPSVHSVVSGGADDGCSSPS